MVDWMMKREALRGITLGTDMRPSREGGSGSMTPAPVTG
jgi:hypothetical protein